MIIEMKSLLEDLLADLCGWKKESMNLKIPKFKLSSLRNKKKHEERQTKSNMPLGHHQVYQPMHNANVKREEKEKRPRRIFEEMREPNSPNLIKGMTLHMQKVQQTLKRIHANRSTLKHIIKLWKTPDK